MNENNQEVINKIENLNQKAMDWWAKHNITTRSVVIVLLILFIATIVAGLLGYESKYYNTIIETLSTDILWITVIIIAGVNGATAILDRLIELKKGNNND